MPAPRSTSHSISIITPQLRIAHTPHIYMHIITTTQQAITRRSSPTPYVHKRHSGSTMIAIIPQEGRERLLLREGEALADMACCLICKAGVLQGGMHLLLHTLDLLQCVDVFRVVLAIHLLHAHCRIYCRFHAKATSYYTSVRLPSSGHSQPPLLWLCGSVRKASTCWERWQCIVLG